MTNELTRTKVCNEVVLEVQGHSFTIDVYTLNLSGPDIVLGTPRLKQIGLVSPHELPRLDYGV